MLPSIDSLVNVFSYVLRPLIKDRFSILRTGFISTVNWVIISIHSNNICLKPPAHTALGKTAQQGNCVAEAPEVGRRHKTFQKDIPPTSLGMGGD